MKKKDKLKLFDTMRSLQPFATLINEKDDLHGKEYKTFEMRISIEVNDENKDFISLLLSALQGE